MKSVTSHSLLLVVVIYLLVLVGCSGAADCGGRADLAQEDLLECVTVEGAREHLVALQEIAGDNASNRAAGTPGYEASVAYVVETLEEAGYDVELDAFDFRYEPPQVLRQSAPDGESYSTARVEGTGYGAVAGPVIAVDLALGEEPWPKNPREATSACEEADFAGLDLSGDNDIALVEGGACLSSVKAVNAQAAGAEAMIILIKDGIFIDEHLTVDRISLLPDASASYVTIPVVATSIANGVTLSQPSSEALLEVPEPQLLEQHNVLAELPGSVDGQVVMAGAHLDSVLAGPGISDTGSGSAALLETAVQMAGMQPRSTVRFAWWGAEEAGLVGSSAYVEGLTEAERAEIALYLNFDMIASPNPATFFYVGKDSERAGAGESPMGSAAIEKVFEAYYTGRVLPFEEPGKGRGSDFLPFEETGVPVGALFTGAEEKMTEAQAALFGGEAGEPYDPCYHKPCDMVDNIDMEIFDVNTDAVAYAVYHYAMQRE
jgi:Zn-dependent M28 family amino/carboxypeptidase